MIDPKLGQRPRIPHLCGPCHRAAGNSGLPTMAMPLNPGVDDVGGVFGLCDGIDGKEHTVQIDHLGEPFDQARLAEIRANRATWDENVLAGHSMIRGSLIAKSAA